MELFTNALLITLGAFAAVAFVWMMVKVTKMAAVVWSLNREEKATREWSKQVAVNRARAKEHFRGLATEALQNPEVGEIVESLRAFPYNHGRTKAAKKQNYERSKIQAKLRKLVADADVRNAIYDMAA